VNGAHSVHLPLNAALALAGSAQQYRAMPMRSMRPAPNPNRGNETMRFMIMFRNDGDSEVDVPPCLDLEEMGRLMDELTAAGILLGSEGLKPSEKGARVRITGGKRSVVDGPFTEAKELVAGFALVQAESKEAAIDLAERFLRVAGQGSAEVREAFETPQGEGAVPGYVESEVRIGGVEAAVR
jgi:hypothetical protein